MKHTDDINRILPLQSDCQHEKNLQNQRQQKHDQVLQFRSNNQIMNRSKNDRHAVQSDCESVISMNCKCRRIPFIAFIVCFLFTGFNFSWWSDTKSALRNGTNLVLRSKSNSSRRNGTSGKAVQLQRQQQLPQFKGNMKERIVKKIAKNPSSKSKVMQRASQNKTHKDSHKVLEPLSESLLPNATFSACLLIRDDNNILSEWIAYHYHAMRLRYLVVAVDPMSTESPASILKTWSSITDLQIVIWDDVDYMPLEFLKTHRPPTKNVVLKAGNNISSGDSGDDNMQSVALEILNHRYRQRVFLNSCMKHVRDVKGMNWLMHIDTDEYIVPSKSLRQKSPDYLQIKPLNESGAVIDLLQQALTKTSHQVSYPCVSMLRVLFGSKEAQMEDIMENFLKAETTNFLNPANFETLRWRYHALLFNQSIHGNPKVILDVAAIPSKYFNQPQEPVFSIHRPVVEYCPKNKELVFSNYWQQPLSVNHYLGSWERYSSRNDKRRSKAVYNSKADVSERGIDDVLSNQLWLNGFIAQVGIDTAKVLFKHYLR